MKHRIVTAAQMKEIERAGDVHGLPYLQMMENAGLAAYAELQKQFPHSGRLLVVCGKGNNGGDGFVIARERRGDDHEIRVGNLRNGRGVELPGVDNFLKHRLHSRLDDVEMAGIGLLDHRRIDVDAYNVDTTLFGGNNCGGKAYVAQSHKTSFHNG